MSNRKRQVVLIGVMMAMLAIATVWNIRWMLQQRDDARVAAADLAQCTQLAAEVGSLRGKPAIASTEAIGVQELGQRIDAASQQASLAATSLEGVFPQSAARVGDSPYLHKPTTLSLRAVSLSRLATFLYHLTDDSPLTLRDLRLRTPNGDVPQDQWDAEATLTYLIYAPVAKARRDE